VVTVDVTVDVAVPEAEVDRVDECVLVAELLADEVPLDVTEDGTVDDSDEVAVCDPDVDALDVIVLERVEVCVVVGEDLSQLR
jgi:hypothetical protein